MVDLSDLLQKLVNGKLQDNVEAGIAIRGFGSVAVEPLLAHLKNPANSNS